MSDFKKNLSIFTKGNIETIENFRMGQSENEHWSEYCKCLITASKAHEVVTKMTKVEKVVMAQLACGSRTRKFHNWFLLNQMLLL